MAQKFFNPKTAASYIGQDTAFGSTPGTMTRMYPIQGTLAWDLQVKEVENEDERVLLFDYLDPVRGNQDGTVKFDYALRPSAVQMSASAAAQTYPVGILLGALLGGKTSTSGSTAGTSTTGSVPVGSGHGVRFSAGQWALFTVNGALEPGRITVVAGDTLTVFPALSGAPTSGSAVINMDNYYPTEVNTNSLTIQHAKSQDSSSQWTFNGCIGDIEFKAERNDIVKVSANLKLASFTTGSQSIQTNVQSDPDCPPIVVRGATTILQAITNGTRTHYPLDSYSVKVNLGLDYVPDMGGIEGKVKPMRVGQRQFAEATVKFTCDNAQADVNWINQTKLMLTVMIPVGSGSSKRWIVLDMPTCVAVGKPKVEETNGRFTHTMTLRSKINQIINPQNELQGAPLICAMG